MTIVVFNPFVFADEGQLRRLDELIATAGRVLATDQPDPPDTETFPTLDEQAFADWQTRCLAFLTDLCGGDHVYVERFHTTVRTRDRRSVRVGRTILAVARDDLAQGHLSQGHLSQNETREIRVLHVDDEAPIRMLVRVNLAPEGGWTVIEAGDGRTGVELARREQPDIVLLNVNLPELDGWEVAEELLADQRTREIPLVFLTARSAFADRARGFDLGAVDYITKPFDPRELAPRLDALVRRIERGDRAGLRREMVRELRALMHGAVLPRRE